MITIIIIIIVTDTELEHSKSQERHKNLYRILCEVVAKKSKMDAGRVKQIIFKIERLRRQEEA